MRILVVGAGAIGSALGGFLANAGHDVTLLGRAWHLDAIRQRGLQISGLWGDHQVQRLKIATQPDEVERGTAFDWILVCVKAHQTESATPIVSQLMGPKTLVCAFQNGLGNYETLTQAIPPSRVALGRVIFGAILEAGHVRVTVCADDVLIGGPDTGFPPQQVKALAEALRASGVPARATSTILVVLWGKVLYNCALNGLSTLLEVPYGKLLEQELTKHMMRAIIEEAYDVAAAHHIPLEPHTPDAYLTVLFEGLIPKTAEHRPSMLQDLQRGKPTEIEALNGAIVRLAQKAGRKTPINALVTRLVHAKERFASAG